MCTIKQDRYSPRFIYTFKRLLVKVSLQPMQSGAHVAERNSTFTQNLFGVFFFTPPPPPPLFLKALYPPISPRFNKKYVKFLLYML